MRAIMLAFAVLLVFAGCDPVEIDEQKPLIDLSIIDAFPVSCDTLYLDESFTWKVRFEDNVELGSYSLEIHHNFDHHAHSTEIEVCDQDPDKDPVYPFKTVLDFEIPAGSQEYIVNETIFLPLTGADGEFETGDYHFYIRLTDREGWSMQKGLSVKILRR